MNPIDESIHFKTLLPGLMVCGLIVLSATFLSEHYGGPQLLYALLIGLSFHFLYKNTQITPGINFAGRTLLRIGVALLGARITFTQVKSLGPGMAILIIIAVFVTIAAGWVLTKVLRRPAEEGFISGGAVAICGASAALAISSVLPQTKENERFTLLAVVGVTVLSTLAMVLYPFLLSSIGASAETSGIFLGGTIHDVAQVVAAGMMLGPAAGDNAVVVKLFRVMLLMPTVLLISLYFRHMASTASASASASIAGIESIKAHKEPLIPVFLMCFIALMIASSSGLFSAEIIQFASDASRWMLVAAIAAAGVKTSFEDLQKLGWQPVLMLVLETISIASVVSIGLMTLR